MKENLKNILCKICTAVILSGCIIFFIGLYYWIIKAGIPYQDPPLELQIQYAIHMGIGDILVKDGAIMLVCGGVSRLILKLIRKNA